MITITVPHTALGGDMGPPGEVAGFGILDHADTRDLVAAAAANPATRWCVTVLHPDGTAAAHGCGAGSRPRPPGQGPPGPMPLRGLLDLLDITKLTPVIRGPCQHARAEPRYRPSRRLQHLIRARNATCAAPGCGRRAAGIEAKTVILAQLARALEVIGQYGPARIATFGGECSVSVAPFSHLARWYGGDLAIVWIDSHPDIGTPQSQYPGYHAMAVAALTGHGDADVQALLPATVPPDRVALAGLHAWDEDDIPNVADWGVRSFSPGELRESTRPLLDWLAATGCSRAAIHFDVDTIDSNEIVLGLGAEPDGLTSAQVRRIVADLDGAVDVVGLTVAEFIPRQVIHLQQILRAFPLISGTTAG